MTVSRPSKVYVLGDQTFDYEDSLAQLLRSDNVLLAWFFRKAFFALNTELGRLPLDARDATPKFSSIADLLKRKRDGCISPTLELVLCLVHAFAAFIWRHSEGEHLSYPTAEDSQLLGLCTGALATAAISSSRDLMQLIPAGVHAVVVALHTGLRSAQEAQSMDINKVVSSSSHSMALLGVSETEVGPLLERFNSQIAKSSSTKAYISASSAGAVTVSGPPHILAQLSSENSLSKLDIVMLPIRGPYHAAHLFSQENIDAILSKAKAWMPTIEYTSQSIPVLSCGTGHSVWTVSPKSILDSAIQDILTRPLVMDKAVNHIAVALKARVPVTALLVPIATDVGETVLRHLKSALASGTSRTPITIEMADQIPKGPAKSQSSSAMGRSKIAVIGMAGRFPGASSPEALWDLLQNKLDMCREVPEMRWNVKTHVDHAGKKKNTSKVRWGCWLDDPDLFDNAFFSISPREAPQVDPAQRLALMTAYEAIESAGVVPGRTPSTREDRVGVFYGVTSNDWCESNSGQDIDAYYIPGANRAFIPGRINYFFKFSGPSYAIDTACSSSLAAIQTACNSLWQGDIDMAIAGGTNVLTNPDMTTGLDKGHFLSETGNCKTFDESADGYCRGEGVATVLLKRLEDALEDGDPIQGIITGAYTNHSAEAESITRPHVGAQKDVFERVLNDSGTTAYDIGFVEMHGTGTQAGDTREMNSVCDVLAPMRDGSRPQTDRRPADQPLHLGALKANIGHGESVSGVSALIKVILMMRHGEIPPHCGIKTRVNPAFPKDLAARNVHIDLESTPWLRARGLSRKAIINNFSAAGGNTSLLVEEPAPSYFYQSKTHPHNSSTAENNEVARPIYPVAISAKCAKSLKANIWALVAHLSRTRSSAEDEDLEAIALQQLSYTTTARRIHHAYRVIVTADTVEQLRSQLAGLEAASEAAPDSADTIKRAVPPRQMLFAFTGQGSQYPGMGRRLLESLGVFRERILAFDQLVRRLGFPSIMPIFRASGHRSGPSEDIADYPPVVVQLANTCMQIVLARIWMSWGSMPTAVVGHSLGEYAALNIAGVLSDADTVLLIGRRAQLLQEMCEPGSHAMLAVLASVGDVERAAAGVQGGEFEIACVNGPKETVLAGAAGQISEVQQALSAGGVRSTLIRVPYAFHSSQITPILPEFAKVAQRVTFHTPQIPVLSPLDGTTIVGAGAFGSEYIVRHARQPVQMMKCLQSAMAGGVLSSAAYAIEFGPHPVVSGMIRSTFQDSGAAITVLPTLRRNHDPWEVLTKSLASLYTAGVSIKWDGYFVDIPSARRVIQLPSYCWELRSFWIPYRNDWTLTKGDIPPGGESRFLASETKNELHSETKPAGIVPGPPKTIKLSTTIHKVLKDEITSRGYDIVVESDVNRADLNPYIRGHTVDGFSLCTPAVYADISFSIGTYVLDRFNSLLSNNIVAIEAMDIQRALIGSAEWKQFLCCTASFDWKCKAADVSFTVHDEYGNKIAQLAACQIKFVDNSDRSRLQQSLATLHGHATRMREGKNGMTCRFSGPMAYRLVSSLAEFNPDYHCIDEVLYDNDSYEAVCRVSFGQVKHGDGVAFHTSPAAIDGLTQSGGFVLNVNDNTKLDTRVFVNHGWKDFQLFETIRDDCQYTTHVRMTEGEDQLWSGDISIFTEDRIVGVVKGVQIQGVPRRLLRLILTQAAKAPRGSKSTNNAGEPSRPAVSSKAKKVIHTKAAPSPDQSTRPDPHSGPLRLEGKDACLSGGSSVASRALKIISEQSGVPVAELRDGTRFDDIGVDSLLSLMITSLIAEELGINADSTLFLENSTVSDVLHALEKTLSGVDPENSQVKDSFPSGHVPVAQTSAVMPGLNHNLPLLSQDEETKTAAIYHPPMPAGVHDTEDSVEDDNGEFGQVLKIISEEVDVPLEQLSDETSLADLGVDSLLSLMIGSRLRDELEIDIDTYSMLTSLGSIGALRKALFPDLALLSQMDLEGSTCSSSSARTSDTPLSAEDTGSATTTPPDIGTKPSPVSIPGHVLPATSVILQGNPRTATSTLFIFPDGSGLASSYASLPRIRADLVVYGLNSPYLKKDIEMNCTWDEMVASYLVEVRRRQPTGPYSFAGWSAGGILSYGAAQVLMEREGEAVHDLIMLDSPAPEHLKPLPEHFFEYCSTSGMFGGLGVAPVWLIAHFRAINKVLSTYFARPLETTVGLRKINILWACESSVDERFHPQPDDPEDMKFLTQKRTDFSPGLGWSRLFAGVSVPVHVDRAVGQHHWNLLKGDSASNVATYIAKVLE